MKACLRIIAAASAFFLFAPNAQADFYLNPRAGAYFPASGGDSSYTLGAALGYGWTKHIATEVGYSHIFATGNGSDGNIITGEGIYHFSLPYVTPYASVGAGAIHSDFPTGSEWDSMALIGGGVTVGPLLFLSVGVGVTYGIVFDGDDFVLPALTLGASF